MRTPDIYSAVLLSDLARAGVTDFMSDDPVAIGAWTQRKPKPPASQPQAQGQQPQAQPHQPPAASAAAAWAPPTEKARLASAPPQAAPAVDIAACVQFFAGTSPLVVATPLACLPGTAMTPPLDGEAMTLLRAMLAAIDIDASRIGWLVFSGPLGLEGPLDSAMLAAPAARVAQLVPAGSAVLALGQRALQVATGQNLALAQSREMDLKTGTCPLVATFHPEVLLTQPALKRQTWRDLLRMDTFLRNMGA